MLYSYSKVSSRKENVKKIVRKRKPTVTELYRVYGKPPAFKWTHAVHTMPFEGQIICKKVL